MGMGYTIMIVDASPDIRTLITDVLSEEGYAVFSCSKDDVVVDTIRSTQPDLALLELFPGGSEAMLHTLRQLRRLDGTQHTPMIISSTDSRSLSRLAQPLDELNCSTLPMPFTIDQLLGCVSQGLQQHTQQCTAK